MDPDKALAELKASMELLEGAIEWGDALDLRSLSRSVVEKFQNLDEWLSKGGFKPEEWL